MKKFLMFICILCSIAILSSCGGSSSSNITNNSANVEFNPSDGGVANGESDVSLTPEIILQFPEAMNPVTLNNNSVILYKNNQVNLSKKLTSGESVELGNITSNSDNTKFYFSPKYPLVSYTTYSVELTSAVKTKTGKSITMSSPLKFTTGGSKHLPTVAIISPTNNATNIDLLPSIQIKFSEAVNNVNTSTVTLHEGSATGTIIATGNLSLGSDNTYTFSPTSALKGQTSYYIVLSDGITDNTGNKLTATSFNFTTVDSTLPDATAPTANILSPSNNASNVTTSPSIQIKFSEAVNNVNTSTVTLHEGSATGTIIATGNLSLGSDNIYTFSPTSALKGLTSYYIVLSDGITDNTGNKLTATSFNFTTVDSTQPDATAPTASILSPSNNASNVTASPSIQIKFSEAVNNVNTSTVTLHEGSATGNIIATGNLSLGSDNTYTFSPTSTLNGETSYYIVLSDGITDNAGNKLTTTSFNFTTGETTAPTVNILSPSDNASNVTTSPSIQIKFSEAVNNVNTSTVTLHEGSTTGTVISTGNLTLESDNTYTFSPTGLLNEETSYYIVLSDGITDNAGNKLNAISFNFTTGATPATPVATWISGSNSVNALGVYGTKGQSNASNQPGARSNSISWIDNSGDLWLFGGRGYGSSSGLGYLNDLWKYDPTTNQWEWVSGSNSTNAAGVYGTKGQADASNQPGARSNSISWIDNSGNLWLFGGSDLNGNLNDLWKYDPTTNQWTWVSGSNSTNALGVYGTKGQADPSNQPGARSGSISWIDNSGNLWLFGGNGYGYVFSSRPENLNDLWKYDPTTNQWTWVSGSNSTNATGVYGTKGQADSSNQPGSRGGSVSWIDNSGNLWLFGGNGYASSSTFGILNDLWKYNPTTNQWEWVSGSNSTNAKGVYGTKGQADVSNQPGARSGSISWIDSSGNLWLFGGSGYNDLWKYNPTTNQWTWMSGSNSTNAKGVYGTKGQADASNQPGARLGSIRWMDNSGNLWLYGGSGYASSSYGYLNDLWCIKIK
jgi:N-acetylneuraminic acid mutarotase